jgi:hypothetical protein
MTTVCEAWHPFILSTLNGSYVGDVMPGPALMEPNQPNASGDKQPHNPRRDMPMQKHNGMYRRFFAMVATSTLLMFALMYGNTFAIDHVFFSQTRMWMALAMGALMGAVMLGFMWSMYHDRRTNLMIIAGAAVVFAASLWLVRSQATVDDVSWMKAMVPHHSIAILTSERAHIRDPRARRLAKDIIDGQRREIAEMKYLIDDIERNGVRNHEEEAAP